MGFFGSVIIDAFYTFLFTAFFIEPLINIIKMKKNTKRAIAMLTAVIVGLALTALIVLAVVLIGIRTETVLYIVALLMLAMFSTLGCCLIMKAVFDGLCNWINK